MNVEREYLALEPYLMCSSDLLRSFLQENLPTGIHVDRVQARAKSKDRFLVKSQKEVEGARKYQNPLSDIQDILAARIIVLYLHEVDIVASYLTKLLRMIERTEKEPEGFSEFGYFGWHAIVRMPEEARPHGAPKTFPAFFEVQVKTIFQHAWAEAEHDLSYKQFHGGLDRKQRRMIAYAAAQAWGADNAFSAVLAELEGSRSRKKSH